MNTPCVWVVVPVFNRTESIFRFIRQLLSQSFEDFRCIVVDHGTVAIDYSLFQDSRITVLKESSDLWWTGAVNAGVKHALQKGCSGDDFILIINDDVRFDGGYIETLVRLGTSHPNSIVGSVCVDESTGEVLSANFSLNRLKAQFVPHYYKRMLREIPDTCLSSDILPGRGMLVPRKVFADVGLFREEDLPHYGADNEFSFRARKAGYPLIVSRDCVVETQREIPLTSQSGRLDLAKKHLFSRKSKANLPTLLAMSTCYFRPPYSLYFLTVNVALKLLSTVKHCCRD